MRIENAILFKQEVNDIRKNNVSIYYEELNKLDNTLKLLSSSFGAKIEKISLFEINFHYLNKRKGFRKKNN